MTTMSDDDSQFAGVARLYMRMLRLHYGSVAATPLVVIAGLLGGIKEWTAFVGVAGVAMLIVFATFAITAMYLGDFECPRCGLPCSFRRSGKGWPLGRCMNCGLSLKRIAAARPET